MGTLKEFMAHYDQLVPNIYVPEPGIMEVFLWCTIKFLNIYHTYIQYYVKLLYFSNNLSPLLFILDILFHAYV